MHVDVSQRNSLRLRLKQVHCVDCREAKCEIINAFFHHFNLGTKTAAKCIKIGIVRGPTVVCLVRIPISS